MSGTVEPAMKTWTCGGYMLYISHMTKTQPPRMGRPPKMDGKTELVAFRLPCTLLRRLDRYTRQVQREGRPKETRADALRFLLGWALETFEQDRAERPRLARQLQALFGEPSGSR
jgi:hypothetical protein